MEGLQRGWELWKKREKEAFKATWHKDGIYWWSLGTIPLGRDRYINLLFNSKIKSFELKPMDIKISGNVAIIMYYWNVTYATDKVYSGRDTAFYMKQDEKWYFMGGMAASCTNLPRCPFAKH